MSLTMTHRRPSLPPEPASDGPVVSPTRAVHHHGLVGRLARCAGVSTLTTVLSLAIIVAATLGLGVEAWIANVVATAIATVPSYSLNRRWTWAKRDASDPWREVLPFWILSFTGLALSTVTVGMADSWAAGAHLAPVMRTAAVLVGHLGGFGLLWIAQFVLLDRLLFAPSAPETGSGHLRLSRGVTDGRSPAAGPPSGLHGSGGPRRRVQLMSSRTSPRSSGRRGRSRRAA